MHILTERTALSAELPFDLEALKTHVRVDFEDSDDELTRMGKTAAAEIEQFAQIALLTQSIRVTIFNPTRECGLRLPIGPVAYDVAPTVTIDSVGFSGFEFVGGLRPYIRWSEAYFLLTPERLTIEYQAGFGDVAADMPDDLAQALLDQAALHYDGRSPMSAKSLTTSPHMARIGARYRGVSV